MRKVPLVHEAGDLALTTGHSYLDDRSGSERLAKADPNNAGWQRDLSVFYNKVGEVLEAQGNLTPGAGCGRRGDPVTAAAPWSGEPGERKVPRWTIQSVRQDHPKL